MTGRRTEGIEFHGNWCSMRVSMHINCRDMGGTIRAGDVVSPIDMEPSFSLPCHSPGVVGTAKECIIVIITANQQMEDSCPGTQATTFGFAGVIRIEVSTVKESMGSRICNVKIGHAQQASQQSRDIAAGGYFAG